MHIPTRPTPFAKLIELGIDGQVLVCVIEGAFGPTVQRSTNAILCGGSPVIAYTTKFSYEEAHRTVAEFDEDDARAFIGRWKGVTASELSTAQSFVIQLCELLGVTP
jgi:hypothetical protein